MAQKNEAPILILSLVITLAALGFGVYWVVGNLGLMGEGGDTPSLSGPSGSTEGTGSPPAAGSSAGQLSRGDRILISGRTSPQKQAGIQAIAAGNYAEAVTQLEASLAANRNDPEALIYLNNARIGTQPAHTLAIVVPASSATDSSEELLRGIAQAQDEVNRAGGIQGTPLRVLIADDGNDPNTAAQVAQTLANQSDVLGVIGHFSSDATLAAGEVYQQQGLPMISATSTSVRISNLGDYIFRTVQSDRFTADSLARHMLNENLQRVVVFYDGTSDYSNSLKDAFTSAVFSGGGQVINEVDVNASGFNASSAVDQAIQQGAEALMLATNTRTRPQGLELVAANAQRLALLGGDSLYNAELLQTGQANANGMVVAAPWHRDAEPGATFPQAARQLWGGDVSWRSAMTYDAVQVFIAAIAQNPTRSGIRQAIAEPGFTTTGASGSLQFLPSGDRNRAAQLVVIQPGNTAGFGYDFVPLPQ
jgi:branched-chain amino acid transport system substrate-binding protein